MCLLLLSGPLSAFADAREGKLELSAIDRDSGKPIAVRVHLINVGTKRPVRPAGATSLGDYFVFYDRVALTLPLGNYRFTMERGPEYLVRSGHFTINNYADDRKTVDMKRFVDMAAEGWYAGDLDVRRNVLEIERMMQAEDVYVAAIVESPASRKTPSAGSTANARTITPDANEPVQFDGKRFYRLLTREYSDRGNGLLLHHLTQPLDRTESYRSSLTSAAEARRAGGWVDAALPFSWDLPLLVAAGKLDSVQIANRHLMRNGVVNHEAGGRPRDPALYPGVQGNGRWSLDIYYHLLNCGLRLPPTAGSGLGSLAAATDRSSDAAGQKSEFTMNTNPLGYNRVYVFVEGDLTWDKWWDGLRAGRAVITNGPLIRPSVEGHPPGYIFKADRGQTVELEIGLTLSTRDKISYLEVVKNGVAVHTARLDQWKERGGKLPPLTFTESGWFVVRAVTDEPATYRYATTAPYYVEIGYQPRISRASAQFFVDWCGERVKQLASASIGEMPDKPGLPRFANQQQHDEALGYWRRAEEFWGDVKQRANAE